MSCWRMGFIEPFHGVPMVCGWHSMVIGRLWDLLDEEMTFEYVDLFGSHTRNSLKQLIWI